MMKWLLFSLSLLIVNEMCCQPMNRQQLRSLFVRATEHQASLDSLLNILEHKESKSPCEESYYGMCNALCIEKTEGNWAKLKLVMKSKNYLNSAVDRDSKDPELRFMRLMLEHFLPSFLGLNKHIADDLRVIFEKPDFIDDNPELKRKAIEFLLWCERCSAAQRKILEKEMALLNKKS